jgi:hypothetical protein
MIFLFLRMTFHLKSGIDAAYINKQKSQSIYALAF